MRNLKFNFIAWFLTCILFVIISSFPIQAQANSERTSLQFLFPDFIKSKVKMKNGQENSIILNYNTVSEKMVYQKGENLYDLTNPEMTDTIFIMTNKFVPVGKVYYEVILAATIPIFVQYKSELLPPGTPAGYGENSQVSNTKMSSVAESFQGNSNIKLPVDYKIKTDLIYWLRKDGNMFSFINARQLLKLFPDKESALKLFIKEKHIKFDRQSDISIMGEYINSFKL